MSFTTVAMCAICGQYHAIGTACGGTWTNRPQLYVGTNGWRCPVCGSGCAPTLERCPCNQPTLTMTGGSVTP